MFADMHNHTMYSDGTDTPEELVERAVGVNLAAISLTDHDNVDGLDKFSQKAAERKIFGIPGVEISLGKIHILGYFMDYKKKIFQNFLSGLSEARTENTRNIFERLNKKGVINHSWSQVLSSAGNSKWINAAHVFRSMYENGDVLDWNDWYGFYRTYFGEKSESYIEMDYCTPFDAIDMIIMAGGIPVLAHPVLIGDDNRILPLIRHGLMGIETFYPAHTDNDVERYRKLCYRYGLFPTGGGDWHGRMNEWKSYPGDYGIGAVHMENFLDLAYERNRVVGNALRYIERPGILTA